MPTSLPPITRALLIANVGVYLLQMLLGDALIAHFALWPLGPDGAGRLDDGSTVVIGFRVWQLLSYGFLHGSVMHLAFNMFALWMFGRQVEEALGAKPFLVYYLVCVLTAALAQLAVIAWFTHGYYPTLGASGGVFGVMLAFASLYPQARIIGFPFFVPIPAWMAVLLYGGLELLYGVTGTQEGVAHFAHLGGMVGGWVLIQYWRGRLPIKPRRQLR